MKEYTFTFTQDDVGYILHALSILADSEAGTKQEREYKGIILYIERAMQKQYKQ